jgi:conjugative transposon TraM protein
MKKEQTKTAKEKRFRLMIPALIFPFLTLGFWALGGGKANTDNKVELIAGFNSELPDANLTEQELDKLRQYEQAAKDSLRRRDAAKNDPYFGYEGKASFNDDAMTFDEFNYGRRSQADQQEEMVYDKLNKLNAVMEQNSRQDQYSSQQSARYVDMEQQSLKDDIARLEHMMLMKQNSSATSDPEMDQISNVLESVLDIQHPERVQERLRQTSSENKGQVYAVSTKQAESLVSLLDNRSVLDYAEDFNTHPQRRENTFYGIDVNTTLQNESEAVAIEAVVHEAQTIVSGSTVKFRLLQDVYINGERIPKDHFIYGLASLNGERLEVEIENIRYGSHLMAVKLTVHDLDGMPGIQVPGAISRDVAKQGGERAIQGVNVGMYNLSLGAQAASAGLEIGKNLLSRKLKLIKIEVKAGYKVYLKDNKRRDY